MHAIQEFKFTSKEFEVISCIINNRDRKKIATILDIAPRTVETHIRNIFFKTKLNSQEALRDLIDKSGKIAELYNVYSELMLEYRFRTIIRKARELIRGDNHIKINIAPEQSTVLKQIATYLKIIQFTLTNTKLNNHHYEIKLLKQDCISNIVNSAPKNIIYLQDKESNLNDHIFKQAPILDCTTRDKLYISFFQILQLLAPDVNFEQLISEFKELKNNHLSKQQISKEFKEKTLINKNSALYKVGSALFVFSILIYILSFQSGSNIKANRLENQISNFIKPVSYFVGRRQEYRTIS